MKILNKKAFSLIELSIVLLIIGIIIAGVTQSSRLIVQFKVSTGKNLTQSGPVASIKGLSAWYETTLETSFTEAESEDSTLVSTPVTTWYDNNPASSIKHNATGSSTTRPLHYANCMSALPCLRFDGTDDILEFDGTFLVGVDYTIFVVEQRRLATALYFLGNNAATTANTGLTFGYSDTSTVTFGHGDNSNLYTVGTSPEIAAYSAPSPTLHTFVNSTIAQGAATFTHYLNGSATASTKTDVGTPALSTLTAFGNAAIGTGYDGSAQAYFTGDIGEIIMYTRALKAEERVSVEDYLLKKWSIRGL